VGPPKASLGTDYLKREYPSQPVAGIGAVIMHDGKILLVKRGSEPGKGKWSIPGGIVELGETVKETTVREVKEETGLDVEVGDLIDVVNNLETDEKGRLRYHFIIIDFLASLKEGSLKAGSDIIEAKWVRLAQVEKSDLTRTFREFFERNRQILQHASDRSLKDLP
jgi:8-oxo-dGTP diphosphatase